VATGSGLVWELMRAARLGRRRCLRPSAAVRRYVANVAMGCVNMNKALSSVLFMDISRFTANVCKSSIAVGSVGRCNHYNTIYNQYN
jgi:hypothetical protein